MVVTMRPDAPLPVAAGLPAPSVGIRLRVGLAALAVILGLGLATLAIVFLTRSLVEMDDMSRARQILTRTQTAIDERFARYEALLYASRSHWESHLGPTLADWEAYVDRIDLTDHFPGSIGLAFIRYTPLADQAAVQGDLRTQGIEVRAERPTDRDYLCLIVRHGPMALNRSAMGIDSCANPKAHPALLAARDSGLPQLSGPLNLHQLPQAAAVAFYLPVYRRGLPQNTATERTQALEGWIAMPMLLSAVLEGIMPTDGSSLRLYDVTPPDADLTLLAAYQHSGVHSLESPPLAFSFFSSLQHAHTLEQTLSLAGRTWTLALTVPHRQHPLPWLVGGLGVVISGLAGALVIGFGHSHARARRLAARITLDLQVMAARLDGIVSAAGEGICGVDPEGRVRFLNPTGATILGLPAERAIDHPIHEVLTVAPAARSTGFHPLHEFLCRDGAHHAGRTQLRLADGSLRHIEYLASPIRSPDTDHPHGPDYPKTPGALLGGVVLFRDIGAQIAADAERSRTLARLERYAAELERFNKLTAHDLQEPLRGIHSYAQILERRYHQQLDEDADRYLRFILEGADRMKALLEDVLEYASTQPPETLILVDADAALQAALNELAADPAFPRAAIDIAPLPTVWADGPTLKRLFIHVLDNAVKFRRPDIPLKITISAYSTDDEVQISVCDNGIGIAPEYHEMIFAGFQRLHPQHKFKGSGVGLAICRKLVAGWNGRIWAQTNPEGGTIVTFSIPEPQFTY